MSQQNREIQKENALILRNETRKGKNTKTRVYNLINDLVDSAVLFDQIVQSGGTGTTTIMSQDIVTSLLNNKLDISFSGNTGSIKSDQFTSNLFAIRANNDVVGQGTVTLTNGSNIVVGNGTNFLDATTGIGLSYWYSFHVKDSAGNIYYVFLSSISNDTTATISGVFSETALRTSAGTVPTTFPGVSGTYSFKIVTSYAKGVFSNSWGNNSYASDYATAIGGSTAAVGQTSMAIGAQTIATGAKAFAGGWGALGELVDRRIRAAGQTSFNFSQNSATQTAGHGALAFCSAILGGEDHNIPVGSSRSAILGGQGIKVSTGVQNTVHFPKVRFGLGTNASITTDNSNDNILVRNSTTGEIEIREASSIGGVSNQVGLEIVTDSSFTASTTSHYIHYSGNTAGTIYLPASPKSRQQIVISDATGNGSTKNITVNGNGIPINGSSTAIINTTYGTLMFVYNGSNWIGSGFIG